MAGSSSAQNEKPPTEQRTELKIEDCLKLALQNNLEIVIEAVNPQIAAQNVRREKGVFDPVAQGSVNFNSSDTPLTDQQKIAAGGLAVVEAEVLTFDTNIGGKLPTGLTYSADYNVSKTQNTFNKFHSEYQGFAGLNFSQPLLKNFWFDNNLAQIRIARKDRQISQYQFKLQVITTLFDTRNAYWNLVFAIEEAKVQEQSLQLAADLLEENQKRVKVGVLSPLEVTQAKAGLAEREDSVIITQRAILDQENRLKLLLYADVSKRLYTRLIPVEYPTIVLRPADRDASIATALKKRPEYLQIQKELEKLDIRVKFDKNQTWPELDLVGSYGMNGLAHSPGASFSDVFGFSKDVWTVGGVITSPLWNWKNKSIYEISQLQKKQFLSKLKQTEQQIVVEVDNACGHIESGLKRVEATRVARQFAEEALAAEQIKMRNGTSTSHNVLQFQDDLRRAQSAEINAVIDYNKTLNDLSKAQGTLLDELGIKVEEN